MKGGTGEMDDSNRMITIRRKIEREYTRKGGEEEEGENRGGY